MKIKSWLSIFCAILILGSAAHAYTRPDQPMQKQICIARLVFLGVFHGEQKWVSTQCCYYPDD